MSKSTEHDEQVQGDGVNSNVKFILKDKQPEQQTEQDPLQQQESRHRQMGAGSLSTHNSKSNDDVLEKAKVKETAPKNKVAQLEKQLEFDREGSEKKVQNLRKELEKTKMERDELEKKLALEKERKEQALTRLSEVAGTKLTDNNAAIADLSDINRPQKLGEMFSEIYDNEWTDAYEELLISKGLQSVGDDVELKRISKQLLMVLQDCNTHCTQQAGILFSNLTDAVKRVGIPKTREKTIDALPGSISKKIKDFRKSLGVDLLECIRETYFNGKQQSTQAVSKYTAKCIQFCWYSALQDPAVNIGSISADKDEQYDSNKYREFTKKGRLVDFLVWPVLYLHEGGALLAKGVVQCKDGDVDVKDQEQRDENGTKNVNKLTTTSDKQEMSNSNKSRVTPKATAFPVNETTQSIKGSNQAEMPKMTSSGMQQSTLKTKEVKKHDEKTSLHDQYFEDNTGGRRGSPLLQNENGDAKKKTNPQNVVEQETAKPINSTNNLNANVTKDEENSEGQGQSEVSHVLANLKKVTPNMNEDKKPEYVSRVNITK